MLQFLYKDFISYKVIKHRDLTLSLIIISLSAMFVKYGEIIQRSSL